MSLMVAGLSQPRISSLSGILMGLAMMLPLLRGTLVEAHPCTVKVFIESFTLALPTDQDGTDGFRWDKPFVAVNQKTNSGDPSVETPPTVQLEQGESHVPEMPLKIFDDVVGEKGDRVHIFIVLSGREIDLIGPGFRSDEGFGTHSETLVQQCTNVQRRLRMKIDVQQLSAVPTPGKPFVLDHNDKGVGVNGIIEVAIRVDIDP
jgi:hypothetical protein